MARKPPLDLPPARRRSMARVLCRVGGAVLLAGCTLTGGAQAPESRFSGPPPERMGVARGAVIVAGPKGFCIDREASRDDGGRSALAVLSACRGLGAGAFAPRPAHPAVLTAAVAPEGRVIDIAAGTAPLDGFFASAPGRGALSRSGQAETVRVLESFAEGDVYFLHLTDNAPFSWGAVQPDYWRGLLQVGGRMVTVSVLTPPDAPLPPDRGLVLLRGFVAALRQASAAAALPAAGENPSRVPG